MKAVRDRIAIDPPPDVVYEFFRSMDDERYRAWHPEHVEFEFVEGETVAEGNVAIFDETIGEEHLRSTVRFTTVRPGEYIEFRDRSPFVRVFNPKNTFAFAPADGGTAFEAAVYLRVGPLERLASVRRDLAEVRRHMREEGENLKRLVETGQFLTGEPT